MVPENILRALWEHVEATGDAVEVIFRKACEPNQGRKEFHEPDRKIIINQKPFAGNRLGMLIERVNEQIRKLGTCEG